MFQTILIPLALDHAELFPKQVEVARRLLAPGGRMLAASVIEDIPTFAAEYMIVRLDPHEVHREVKRALTSALKPYPEIEGVILTGKPGVVLAEHAASIDADLIVTCASRPGSDGYALGSTASRLARRATCSVIVIR